MGLVAGKNGGSDRGFDMQDADTPLVHFLGVAARRAAAIYGRALHEITRQVRISKL